MTLARTALEAGSSHLFIVQQSEARQHVNLPASAFEGRFLKDKKSDSLQGVMGTGVMGTVLVTIKVVRRTVPMTIG